MTPHFGSYSSRITLDGPDTAALLERLVTCRVEGLVTGGRVPGALLTPQGKVLADFWLTRTETGAVLEVSGEIAADLEKRLKLFRLRADVEVTRAQNASGEIDHAARIEAVQPMFGFDFETASVFPTDINLDIVGGVDYKKGCFVGQEVASRMARRGKIRKRTVRLSGARLETGMEVRMGERRIGYVTSTNETQALAVLRTDHLQAGLTAGETLSAGGHDVAAYAPDWLQAEMDGHADG